MKMSLRKKGKFWKIKSDNIKDGIGLKLHGEKFITHRECWSSNDKFIYH